MANKQNSRTALIEPTVYRIKVQGHLGRQGQKRFEGLAITLENNGDTVLTGLVVDQSALFGLLRKVRDLGIPLLSVNPVEPDQQEILDIKI